MAPYGATEAQDFIIINPKNGPFNVSKFKEACVKRKLEAGNLLVARVGPDHVTKYKHWGTTADRDVVVRVDFNIQVPDEAIHKPLLGALKGTHPSMRLSPRLKA